MKRDGNGPNERAAKALLHHDPDRGSSPGLRHLHGLLALVLAVKRMPTDIG